MLRWLLLPNREWVVDTGGSLACRVAGLTCCRSARGSDEPVTGGIFASSCGLYGELGQPSGKPRQTDDGAGVVVGGSAAVPAFPSISICSGPVAGTPELPKFPIWRT